MILEQVSLLLLSKSEIYFNWPPGIKISIVGNYQAAIDIEAAIDTHYIEDTPARLYRAHMTLADRRARVVIEDEAAGQCRGELGVHVDSLTALLDLAVADATARSYRRPLPVCLPPALTPRKPPPEHIFPFIQRRGRQRRASRPGRTTPRLEVTRISFPLPSRLSGQSFAIEN